MNDITLCTMHTEKPYYIKEINKNIYSIEELSYYLFNYLYLIDDQFFSEGLIDYIENTVLYKKFCLSITHPHNLHHKANLVPFSLFLSFSTYSPYLSNLSNWCTYFLLFPPCRW